MLADIFHDPKIFENATTTTNNNASITTMDLSTINQRIPIRIHPIPMFLVPWNHFVALEFLGENSNSISSDDDDDDDGHKPDEALLDQNKGGLFRSEVSGGYTNT